jgi:hypothetical protein
MIGRSMAQRQLLREAAPLISAFRKLPPGADPDGAIVEIVAWCRAQKVPADELDAAVKMILKEAMTQTFEQTLKDIEAGRFSY